MSNDVNYRLEGNVFIIDDYDKMPAFSSFLPGLAGIKGIPIWVFYDNRGQIINSFGIHNKGNAIMEFNPANTAYENTSLKGFRTFLKVNNKVSEAFRGFGVKTKRSMYIKPNSVSIQEHNQELGVGVEVNYFVLPYESIGSLVRRVTITNEIEQDMSLQAVDGMPKIIPYGMKNGEYKEMSNLLKSWTEILNLDHGIPYYKMRSTSNDSSQVSEIDGGYFYFSELDGKLQPVIYDADTIFAYDNSLTEPIGFYDKSALELSKGRQCFYNKVPCGFTPIEKLLKAGEKVTFTTYIGYAASQELLNAKAQQLLTLGYAREKEKQADSLIGQFTQDVKTHSGMPVFDQYIEQCYIDNLLRGGFPFVFEKGKKKSIIHLFSRKHGDPERDYNFFSVAGEYYSQGNGNFRDVCQNRRNDVFFHHNINDFNIYNFFSLIQADGYNPLEIRQSTFTIEENKLSLAVLMIKEAIAENFEKVVSVIKKPFTPGSIANTIAKEQLVVTGHEDELIQSLLSISTQHIEAGFGEGYWSDHWDYLMDLVENYLYVFPDKKENLLFEDRKYLYYDSPAVVLKREDKYVLDKGRVRQYGSIRMDEKKLSREDYQKNGTNWLKNQDGTNAVTTLFGKMITLAVNKFALLDAYGMGIEMEGGKPGWNDAMNGLPGLFGSSMAEGCELRRLLTFLDIELNETKRSEIELPTEIMEFMTKLYTNVVECNKEKASDFNYWDQAAALREEYRELTCYSLSGSMVMVSVNELKTMIHCMLEKVQNGCQRALALCNDLMPTYFTYEVSDYAIVSEKVQVKAFNLQILPAFLEGPARCLTTMDKAQAKKMHEVITASDIYDKKLKMYKTSESIKQLSLENGRIRAFTPGWLERESIFLHMEYKYFLALLKAGLYDEYYKAIKDALIPFLQPKQYGRSILENSSFIASSANPDESVHGRGYVARLSGSTVEVLSMWIYMFFGQHGFHMRDHELCMTFAPKLAGWMFDDNNEASAAFLSNCSVTYHNSERKNTFGDDAAVISKMIYTNGNQSVEIAGDTMRGEDAKLLRAGNISHIDIYLN